MKVLFWAVAPLAFMLGCAAHSLTHEVPLAPQSNCDSAREEIELLRARVVVLEERLAFHIVVLREFRRQLGLREREE